MKTKVQDVMTREVVTVGESTPFKEIVELLARNRISAVPVLDAAGHVAGVVSEADLLLKQEHPEGTLGAHLFELHRHRIERAKAAGTVARQLMTRPAVTIGEEAGRSARRRDRRSGGVRLPALPPTSSTA
jgi:CBS domain-containing protein